MNYTSLSQPNFRGSMQKITLSLPDPVAHQFFAEIPKGKRSQYMTKALKSKLKQDAKEKALKELLEFEPIASEIDAVETLREIREEREEQLMSNLSCFKK